jgi:hypothetical protein
VYLGAPYAFNKTSLLLIKKLIRRKVGNSLRRVSQPPFDKYIRFHPANRRSIFSITPF